MCVVSSALPQLARVRLCVAQVAFKLNDSLKRKGATMRVAEIQSSLSPAQPLVGAGRRLTREGPMLRVTRDMAGDATDP